MASIRVRLLQRNPRFDAKSAMGTVVAGRAVPKRLAVALHVNTNSSRMECRRRIEPTDVPAPNREVQLLPPTLDPRILRVIGARFRHLLHHEAAVPRVAVAAQRHAVGSGAQLRNKRTPRRIPEVEELLVAIARA